MATILAKRGNEGNAALYEHICDTYADVEKIPKNQINLGSTCLVLKGKNNGVEVYMANTKKQWILLSDIAGGGSGGGSGSGDDEIPTDAERVTEEELEEMLNG